MATITLVLTEQQTDTLRQIMEAQGLNRSDAMRLALENLAMESGLEWPQDMPSHGDFSRARGKRRVEKDEKSGQ
jgi:antitoxin component of RelBE/YafQ-DinJ toxin-antitoxin module